MSRTKRIYNRKPWLFFWAIFGSSRSMFHKMMNADPSLQWVFFKHVCMGHCKGCKKSYYEEPLRIKRRDLQVEVRHAKLMEGYFH